MAKVYILISIDDDLEGETIEGAFVSEREAEIAKARLYDKVTGKEHPDFAVAAWAHPPHSLLIREVAFWKDGNAMPVVDHNSAYGPNDNFEEERAKLFAERDRQGRERIWMNKVLSEPPVGGTAPMPTEYNYGDS